MSARLFHLLFEKYHHTQQPNNHVAATSTSAFTPSPSVVEVESKKKEKSLYSLIGSFLFKNRNDIEDIKCKLTHIKQ